ncbi:MAG TPA: stalk domain-containing protein [Armatimonadota bacterium]|nr:hypothetical protein [Armatimonadota bacterium]HOJ20591.1 stalk domain-containing protein [Armatimonadota bacterium]HOM81146.1 stalk domain-containing protein [Armatimonadota bacterium]HOQ28182.1 stalk domain-containing protein [Armatimonadota bacterium]HPO71722.1 stalk domain-containing protein [Armatimonadota bacterium]
MKRCLILTALAGLLVAGASAPGVAALFQVEAGGVSIFTTQPVTMDGTVLVPLRQTLTQLGVTDLTFDPATSEVRFTARGQSVVMEVAASSAMVGGETVALAQPVQRFAGQIWVPAAFISQIFPDFNITQVRGFRFAPEVTPEITSPIPQTTGPSSVSFNGRTVTYSSPTWYMGNVLMVPVNETLEALGIAAPQFNPGDLQLSFIHEGSIVRMNAQSGFLHIGDQAFPMARPAVERDGILYAPASSMSHLIPGLTFSVPQG